MRLYALLLYLLPPSFRRAYGAELLQVARTAHRRGDLSLARLTIDLLRSIAREWRPNIRRTRPKGSVMHDLLRDTRYATRLLLKQPGFTVAAVLTLALGIGANTAMFSLAEATLLRPVKVAQPDRLVSWTWASAYPDFVNYTALTDTFDGVIAWAGGSRVNAVIDGPSELAAAMYFSGNAFNVLGVHAALGRVILPADDVRNGPIVAVLSYDFWQSRFGGDANVVGRSLQINNQPVTIIGVAQQGFRGVTLGLTPAVYLPVSAAGQIRGGFFGRPEVYETTNFVWLNVIGRLREGVSREHASAVVETRYRQLHPPQPGRSIERLTLQPLATRALSGSDPESIQRFVLLLVGVVALTLLIGCANLASLLLAKAARRRQEIGLRLAIGASRSHVIRQMVVESLLLALAGAAAGLLIATAFMRVLSAYELPGGLSIEALNLSLNGATLSATAAFALTTAILFGAAPAWHASRTDVMVTLRDSTRAARPTGLRSALVAAQVAVSLILLAGTGLFARSLAHAIAMPTGFIADGVATASVNPGLVRYDAPRVSAYYAEALDRVRALPGVTAAAWTNIIPSNGLMINTVQIQGYEPADGRDAEFYVSQVTADYFEAAGTRLLSGRTFTARDNAGAPLVAIISRTAADTFWPGQNPLGRQMKPSGPGDWRTVIGVVEDVTVERLGENRVPYVFFPFDQAAGSLRFATDPAHLLVRTSGDPRDLLGMLTSQLRAIDPRMPLYDIVPFTEHVRELVMPQQMGATLLGFFSVLALSLASVGIYGVAAYVAQLRTRELGIRIALGADAAHVQRLVLRHGIVPAACGVLIGIALAAWAAPLVRAFLYDVSTTDPLTFTVVPLLLLLLAFAATWLPARRAARLDPVAALRDQ
jgi:predicted permease